MLFITVQICSASTPIFITHLFPVGSNWLIDVKDHEAVVLSRYDVLKTLGITSVNSHRPAVVSLSPSTSFVHLNLKQPIAELSTTGGGYFLL